MELSILKEDDARRERRVALIPSAVRALVRAGHGVTVETGAGVAAGFPDQDFEQAGARIAHRRQEALGRGQLVVSLTWLHPEDLDALQEDAVILNLERLDLAPRATQRAVSRRPLTVLSADRLRDQAGNAPVRERMSELAGALAPQLTARLLESSAPGRHGVLLAPLPGVHPAEVVVVGAGTLGIMAARQLARLGASVHLLDSNLERLESCWDSLPPNVFTALATPDRIHQTTAFANAVVVAVRTTEPHTPAVLTESMVRDMRPGSVLLDFSIDGGGGAATSRPIAGPEETYSVHGVLHFSMPNSPSLVARTASKRLSHALLPFLHQLADGASPRGHRTFAQAVWWGEQPE